MKATVAVTLTAGLPAALASAILKPRVIGPDEPTDRYKFVVSIQDSKKAHSCGGMLLDSTTVLTASHCFLNTTDAGFVTAGKTDLEAAGGVTVKISTLQRPDHKPVNYQAKGKEKLSDIGIIKLATPIETSDSIEYAPLPTSDSIPDGSKFVALGWGRDKTVKEGDAPFSVPKRAEALLEQQPMSKCVPSQIFGDQGALICAGKPGKTVCSGDSGGPLIDSKTGVLLGLVSISVMNAQGVGCADANIFTRIGSHLDFINANLGEKGFDDGDNQRIKDEAKMKALQRDLAATCKQQYDGKYNACVSAANASLNNEWKSDDEKWAAYDKAVAECKVIQARERACSVCVADAKLDSTPETLIQCSEKGN
ncbi:Serine/cysteine peptidase, trypsin-like protein [Cordyceps fumosorosea ARSEF 2679]|uniref:Serine/cysteine peptidase, trypsin-like protein n=1 Tax=Cordyceps fumosorosea (strain ARSEF 2679) TaxID=1081104 RepID=A0A167TQY9_CORFA|nr:Serine/cysteine peptidase, trypsin-like protein [Cordyceps fumosorosea ARSEF 2679]OAA60855.1 Serine/cysteine peptidase, trypsin-like protein [Cordyceps fumosorosea ARSEF 2679]